MSKFNNNISTKTVNLAGGEAYAQSPKLELVSILLTSFMQDKAYRSEAEEIKRITELVEKMDPEFSAKASIFARKEYGMRSVSHLMASLLAKKKFNDPGSKKGFYRKIVNRTDDITEILALLSDNGNLKGKLNNAMRRGFALALAELNEYKLAKYIGSGKAINLYDAVNLLHPKQTPAISKLMKEGLKNTETWEAKISEAGGDKEAESEAWKDLLSEGKLGYLALVKNLRNIVSKHPELTDLAIKELTNPEKIKDSLVLPFRYLDALEEVEKIGSAESRKMVQAISKAIDIACINAKEFAGGNTLVVLDVSGSMMGKPAQIGSIFAAVLAKGVNADLMVFSDNAKYKTYNPDDSTLTLAKSVRFATGGTNFHSIFQTANKAYDRIIILSDMQGWVGYNAPSGSFIEYKSRVGANPFIYSFDLNGYGSMQFPESNVFAIAGFSDKVFDTIKMLETDKNTLINEIEKISLVA